MALKEAAEGAEKGALGLIPGFAMLGIAFAAFKEIISGAKPPPEKRMD